MTISLLCAGQVQASIVSGLYTFTSQPGHPSCGMEVRVSTDGQHLVTRNVTNPETGMACDLFEGLEQQYNLVSPDTYVFTDSMGYSTLSYLGGGQFSIIQTVPSGVGDEMDLAYFGPGPAPKPTLFRGSGLPPSGTDGSVEYYCKLAYRAAVYSAQEQCQSHYSPSLCQAGKIMDVEYDKFSSEGFVSCSAYLFLKLK